MTDFGLFCPDCGLPVVSFGGEDICMLSCNWCGAHDCDCERDDRDEDDDDGL